MATVGLTPAVIPRMRINARNELRQAPPPPHKGNARAITQSIFHGSLNTGVSVVAAMSLCCMDFFSAMREIPLLWLGIAISVVFSEVYFIWLPTYLTDRTVSAIVFAALCSWEIYICIQL